MKKQEKKLSRKEVLRRLGKTESQLKAEGLKVLNASDEEFEAMSEKHRRTIDKIAKSMKSPYEHYMSVQKKPR